MTGFTPHPAFLVPQAQSQRVAFQETIQRVVRSIIHVHRALIDRYNQPNLVIECQSTCLIDLINHQAQAVPPALPASAQCVTPSHLIIPCFPSPSLHLLNPVNSASQALHLRTVRPSVKHSRSQKWRFSSHNFQLLHPHRFQWPLQQWPPFALLFSSSFFRHHTITSSSPSSSPSPSSSTTTTTSQGGYGNYTPFPFPPLSPRVDSQPGETTRTTLGKSLGF